MKRSATSPASCRIAVKVTPNAKVDEIKGFAGDVLLVRIKAPPVDGKANTALVRLIAEQLGVPRGSVTVERGTSARTKLIGIVGISREVALARLGR